MFSRSLFVLFLLTIVFSVLLQFTDSDNPFDTVQLFLLRPSFKIFQMKLKCYGRRQKQDVDSQLRIILDNTDGNETGKARDLLVDLCRSYLEHSVHIWDVINFCDRRWYCLVKQNPCRFFSLICAMPLEIPLLCCTSPYLSVCLKQGHGFSTMLGSWGKQNPCRFVFLIRAMPWRFHYQQGVGSHYYVVLHHI